jgi:hypothetical protein
MDSTIIRKTIGEIGRRTFAGRWRRVLLLWIMSMLIRYFLGVLLLLPAAEQSFAQSPAEHHDPLVAGKVLRYKVKWSFIRLGTVTIRQVPADSGRMLLQMSVQSTPSLPFIDVHFSNQTYVTGESASIQEETIFSGKELTRRQCIGLTAGPDRS